MKEQIEVIVKRPDEAIGHKVVIPNTLKEFQRLVQGYIETVRVEDTVIICNEEGRILHLPYNCSVGVYDFYGTIVLVGADEDEFTDCPKMIWQWAKWINR